MERKQMKSYTYLHLISKPFSSKALNYQTSAGLLTYPHFGWPSHTKNMYSGKSRYQNVA
jgi:hypothetical protein